MGQSRAPERTCPPRVVGFRGLSSGPGGEMYFDTIRGKRFPGSRSLFPNHESSTTLTTTEIGSNAALRSRAERANARCQELPLSRGKITQRAARAYTHPHEAFTMHILVDLKVCESCGSLWYRATGEVQVYCGSCAVKLGAFPLPRPRRRPGGRRKLTVTCSEAPALSTGGGR